MIVMRMKITIDEQRMIEAYWKKELGGSGYAPYVEAFNMWLKDGIDEHILSINDNPILVCGNAKIVDFNDKDIWYKDGFMICGNGKDNNRKWRELRNVLPDGRMGDPYIMTYETMLNTFGVDAANYLFYFGEVPEWW